MRHDYPDYLNNGIYVDKADLAIPVADPTAYLCNADVSERIISAQLVASRSKTPSVPKNKIYSDGSGDGLLPS